VLVGYLNGIALSIIAGQIGKLLGIPLANRDFLPSLLELAGRLGDSHWPSLAVGAATLTLLITLRQFAPRAPAALIATPPRSE
jgi:MFS superfamily sulfate permease-like transporter